MKKELKILFTAFTFYTRIPCYRLGSYTSDYLSRTTKYLPFVGWIVGGIGAVIFILLIQILPITVSVLLSMISTVMITGAFHEDGFADSCDGFGGGASKEQVLTIMKDSGVGTYAVVGLIFMLSLKFLTLIQMPQMPHKFLPFVLIAGHSVSRYTAATILLTHKYARENNETSKTSGISQKLSFSDFLVATFFGIFPIFWLGYRFLPALIPIFLVRILIGYYLNKRIQGYTGDSLGAVQQITEVIFYVFVLIILSK